MIIRVQSRPRSHLKFGVTFREELLDEFVLCSISLQEITPAHTFWLSETDWHSILIGHFSIQIVEDLGVKCRLPFLFRLCLRSLLQDFRQSDFLL